MNQIIPLSKKICMLGSFGVGKTSLVRRFVYNEFQESYQSTLGVQIHKQSIQIGQIPSYQFNFILWDIAHIEKFDNVIKNYFHGAHGAVVVFDVTRAQIFDQVDSFLKPFLMTNPQSKLVFVANKIDLAEPSERFLEQLLQISKLYRKPYVQTSAKQNLNIETVFTCLAEQFIEAE